MHLFVITTGTSDFGDRYVVRPHRALPGRLEIEPTPISVTTSLMEARETIPPGCVFLGRQKGDDPVIVETWGLFPAV